MGREQSPTPERPGATGNAESATGQFEGRTCPARPLAARLRVIADWW